MTTTLPKLEGFEEHYGIQVSCLGEDGDLVALGHHSPRRVLAAMRKYARGMFGDSGAGPETFASISARFADLATGCDGFNEADHDAQICGACREIKSADWWMRVTPTPAPDRFPVMYWSC